jgi:tRNA(Glu) U13 pseudouridine synthase TruD
MAKLMQLQMVIKVSPFKNSEEKKKYNFIIKFVLPKSTYAYLVD